jgi:molecular chaperone GrpE
MPSSPETDTTHDDSQAAPEPGSARGADELTAELARIEDRHRRALADLDNYRKRAAREMERRVTDAGDSLIRDWLDVVDSVERAIAMQGEGPCAEGLRAVLAQMDSVLQRHGARRIQALGTRFDPERHEAIAVRTGADAPDGIVLAVERNGYEIADRVLRPAQVVVARSPEHPG